MINGALSLDENGSFYIDPTKYGYSIVLPESETPRTLLREIRTYDSLLYPDRIDDIDLDEIFSLRQKKIY